MRRDRACLVAALVVSLAFGCGRNVHAPDGWLPRADDVGQDAYGGWIVLHVVVPDRGEPVVVPASAAWQQRQRTVNAMSVGERVPGDGAVGETAKDQEFRPRRRPAKVERRRKNPGRVEAVVLEGELIAVDRDSVYVLLEGGALCAAPHDRVARASVARFDPRPGGVRGQTALGILSSLSHGVLLVVSVPLWFVFGTASVSGHTSSAKTTLRDGWDALAAVARFPQGPPPGLRDLGLTPKRRDLGLPAGDPSR